MKNLIKKGLMKTMMDLVGFVLFVAAASTMFGAFLLFGWGLLSGLNLVTGIDVDGTGKSFLSTGSIFMPVLLFGLGLLALFCMNFTDLIYKNKVKPKFEEWLKVS